MLILTDIYKTFISSLGLDFDVVPITRNGKWGSLKFIFSQDIKDITFAQTRIQDIVEANNLSDSIEREDSSIPAIENISNVREIEQTSTDQIIEKNFIDRN